MNKILKEITYEILLSNNNFEDIINEFNQKKNIKYIITKNNKPVAYLLPYNNKLF